MNIISLNLAHIRQLLAIESVCFSTPWSRDTMEWALTESDIHGVGLENDNSIVAYGFLRHSIVDGKPYEQSDLLNIAVAPIYQGMGYGKALLSNIMNLAWHGGAKQIFLEVRESNKQAQQLYVAAGFSKIGFRRGYYSSPEEDAVIMISQRK